MLDDTGKRASASHGFNRTGVMKRPLTADPSLGTQAVPAAIGSVRDRDRDRDSGSTNVMEIHQGGDSSLSPLRNRSFRAKEETIHELFPTVVESERKPLSVLDSKMSLQDLHAESMSPGGYFEKRKPLNKVVKVVPRVKPRSAVPSNRKQHHSTSSDHSRSAQFDFKKSVDDVRPENLRGEIRNTYHGSTSSSTSASSSSSGNIAEAATSSKESKESDTPEASLSLPHGISGAVKEADSSGSDIRQ